MKEAVAMSENAHIPSEQELAVLASVINQTTRARRLRSDEAQEFAQTVHLRLLETGYDAYHASEGRAPFGPISRSVVAGWSKDWRNNRLGRCGPSPSATRSATARVGRNG